MSDNAAKSTDHAPNTQLSDILGILKEMKGGLERVEGRLEKLETQGSETNNRLEKLEELQGGLYEDI